MSVQTSRNHGGTDRRPDHSGTYLLYDGVYGTGVMLTVAEKTLSQLAAEADRRPKTARVNSGAGEFAMAVMRPKRRNDGRYRF